MKILKFTRGAWPRRSHLQNHREQAKAAEAQAMAAEAQAMAAEAQATAAEA
jgi:hypothetical protein